MAITLQQAIEVFGTRYRVAKICGVNPSTIYGSWNGRVPEKHWLRLAALSGGRLQLTVEEESRLTAKAQARVARHRAAREALQALTAE